MHHKHAALANIKGDEKNRTHAHRYHGMHSVAVYLCSLGLPIVDSCAPCALREPIELISMLLKCRLVQYIPALMQGILTKGLQHGSALVQQATLSMLCHVLSAVERVLASLDRAQRVEQRTYDRYLRDCAAKSVQQGEASGPVLLKAYSR